MINNEKILENKKEDKRSLKKYIILLIVSMFIGAFIGALEGADLIKPETFFEFITIKIVEVLSSVGPYANIIITLIGGTVVVSLYKKARKLYSMWDNENEEEIAYIERMISYALWLTYIIMILSYFFFSAGIIMIRMELISTIKWVYFICWFVGAFIPIRFTKIVQQKIVNFIKEINPEKKGSIFDTKFSKKWIESCDEAEKLVIYKSSYKSLQAVAMTCMILWAISLFGMLFCNLGIGPVIIITILLLVQVSCYCKEAIRLQKFPQS